jgi:4-hydroxy-3-methylbut-2-enyl diphosphate reductase
MKITIDEYSGFCFGVTSAIEAAERELQKGQLFCLGDIVHNGQEVERLDKLGLETIDYDDLRTLHNVRVLLRAHGEPPSTYHIARRNNIDIIDASCPVVLHLQKRIRETYQSLHGKNTGAQIVIFGKKGHAEVIGLEGQTNNTAIVIEHIADLNKIDFTRPIYLFSQTTKSVEEFETIVE